MTSDGEPAALDLDHLARQTFSDPLLEREVLVLFRGQCEALGSAILGATDPASRALAAHTLTGAARAVGASSLAGLAAAIEAGEGAHLRAEADAAFRAALAAVTVAVAARIGILDAESGRTSRQA